MEIMEVSSSKEGKRDLITLDLLGGCVASVVGSKDHLDLALETSLGCHSDLHPLDLNLLPVHDGVPVDRGLKPAAAPPFPRAQSVCTIEQVKRALQLAEGESRRRREAASTTKRRAADGRTEEEAWSTASDGSLVAAGCPGCLSYVLVSKAEPRCPRCESQAPLTVALPKRPRFDLNSALAPW